MSTKPNEGFSTKALSWAFGVGVFIMLGLGLVLLFLLTQATQRWDLYEQYYTTLFVLNTVVAGFLLSIIIWIVLRLIRRWRSGKFGSRLLLKLASIFMVVGFIPGLLIYAVSYQFVSRSIEAWFDVKVEGALNAGLNLGRATLDTLALDLGNKARAAALHLSENVSLESLLEGPLLSNKDMGQSTQRGVATSDQVNTNPSANPVPNSAGSSSAHVGLSDSDSGKAEGQKSEAFETGGLKAPLMSSSPGLGVPRLQPGLQRDRGLSTLQPHDAMAKGALKRFSGASLERLREQLGVDEIIIWSSDQRPVATAGGERYVVNPEPPTPEQWRALQTQKLITVIEGLEDAALHPEVQPQIRALALVNPVSLSLHTVLDSEVLQISRKLPPTLVANALALQAANVEYQERALARDGLRRMYIGTLTLSLFLSVFGAVILAVLLGNQLARPLLWLVSGVREVAAGNLNPKPVLTGKDDLEGLTQAFAQMTQQLFEARTTVERSMSQVSLARANLQTILDHLTAGVLVLDPQGRVVSANPGATRILRLPMAAFVGSALTEVPGLEAFAAQVLKQFQGFEGDRLQAGQDYWQQSFELRASVHSGALTSEPLEGNAGAASGLAGSVGPGLGGRPAVTNLIARGAVLPNQAWLLVFDDISEVVSAERAQAWGEVARRLAHEIKNPLTPIQLSAERLEMKLSGKLAPAEQTVLMKSVKMIVDQVDAMKRLVNEFRDYARLPQAQMQELDLNGLVHEVVQLYGLGQEEGLPTSVQETPLGEVHAVELERQSNATLHQSSYTWGQKDASSVRLEMELDLTCPPIQADALQMRQVIHNLMQNAQDATVGQETRVVSISTHFNHERERVRLVVRDTGGGFAEDILKRAFEPYVTTKARGTGLGLAVVKKIADEHGARILLKNLEQNGAIIGAQVSLSFAVVQAQHHGV
jgi:nitrogen fixation/metabolism regulation signal transduction histidine kinase